MTITKSTSKEIWNRLVNKIVPQLEQILEDIDTTIKEEFDETTYNQWKSDKERDEKFIKSAVEGLINTLKVFKTKS